MPSLFTHAVPLPIAALVLLAALASPSSSAAEAAPLPPGCDAAGRAVGASSTPAGAVFPPIQLALRTPLAPTLLPSGGQGYLVYELHLQNFSGSPMRLRGIEVLDADLPAAAPLAGVGEAQLAARLRRLTIDDAGGDPRLLGPGQGTVAFLCLAFERSARVPARLRHRVLLEDGAVDGPAVSTRAAPLPVLGRPLAGDGWTPSNNPSLASHHRMGLWVVDGSATIARRYAIDWKRFDAAGKSYAGDPRAVHSYYAYGQPVLAVADASVAAAVDGYPDNVPRTADGFAAAVPVTRASVAGNHVVLDLGGGRYVHYAHLAPGSVRVRAGQRVRRGQLLGRVGNSGDAREPHLHFQLADSADVLASEGLPHVFARYRVRAAEGRWEARTGEYPMGQVVVDFGPAGR